uniref:Ig-like domain-containing protein n=1 Tax=uncultured Pseudoteredinibacter sp. TaxID=1641701 RepID=UPI002632611A
GNVRTDASGADVDGADAAAITGVVAGTQTGDISGGVNTPIAGSLGSLTLQADGSYTYTPSVAAESLALGVSATDTFSYTLKDADGSFSTTTITITVTGTNQGPQAVASSKSGNEDVAIQLGVSDFGFTDVDTGDQLSSVRIDSLPADGTLMLNGVAVAAGQVITAAELNNTTAPNTGLQFVPDQHESGSDAYGGSGTGDQQADYASFTFSVNDGNAWSAAPASFTVDVTPDADPALIDTSLVNYNSGNNQHIDLVEIPSSDRFTREVYNNAATGPQAGNQLENISAGLNGTVSTPAQPYNASGNNGATDIGARQLQKVTSLIYLEAGQTVSFSGYMDDAVKIELGGNVLLHTSGNTWGPYNTATAQTVSQGAGSYTAAGTYTVSATGYYTLETYVYNHSGPGDFSIRIHLDGGGPQALSNSNVVVFRDVDTLEATGAQYSEFVPGPTAGNANHNTNVGGYYPIELNKGGEGAKIKLSGISVQLQDTDGSESIASITLGNIPDGWEVYDGNTLLFTAGGGNNSVDISSADLNNLFVRSTNSAANGATVDYDLEVTAVVNETANGTVVDTQSSTGTLTVSIFDTQNVSASPLKKAPEQAQQDAIDDVQESSQSTGKSKTTAGGLLAEQDDLLLSESPAADSAAEFNFASSDEPSYAVELQDVLALDKSEQSLDALLPKALETKSVNVKSLEADSQTSSDAPDVLVWNDAISELPEIKTESDLVDII